MKLNKTTIFSLFTCIILTISTQCHAQEMQENQEAVEDSYGKKISHKTLTALANISLGIIEIPKNIIIVSNDTNLLYGLTGGTGLGLLNTAGRISVGLLDLLTFPIPTQPIAQPVYPWDHYLLITTSYNDMFVMDSQTENLTRQRQDNNMHY